MRIFFGCQSIPFDDLLTCSYGLNKTERKVFKALLGHPTPWDVMSIAKQVRLERSGVQKALNSLLKKGLVSRVQGVNKRGGIIYRYQAKPVGQVEAEILGLIEKWCGKASATVKAELARLAKKNA